MMIDSLFKSEDDLQTAIITYCNRMGLIDKRWLLIFAIPNGGFRNIATASRLKRTGVKAGIPDLFLASANNKYHGLFLEVKNGLKKKLSLNQIEWLKILNAEGYKAITVYSLDEAIDEIDRYFK